MLWNFSSWIKTNSVSVLCVSTPPSIAWYHYTIQNNRERKKASNQQRKREKVYRILQGKCTKLHLDELVLVQMDRFIYCLDFFRIFHAPGKKFNYKTFFFVCLKLCGKMCIALCPVDSFVLFLFLFQLWGAKFVLLLYAWSHKNYFLQRDTFDFLRTFFCVFSLK